MKGKTIPPAPASIEAVFEVWETLPQLPEPAPACHDRLRSHVCWIGDDITAGEWIEFLHALGLVRIGPAGMYRTRNRPDRQVLIDRFLDGIYGAEEVNDMRSMTSAHTLDELASAVRIPPWEQRRHEAPELVWRERTERLVDWFILLDLITERNGRYRAT